MGKSFFRNLIPKDGIKTTWNHKLTGEVKLTYVDGGYAPDILHDSIGAIVRNEPNQGFFNAQHIFKGNQVSRRFRVFVFQEWKMAAIYTFKEILDNPHGYGTNDFLYEKYLFPEYRQSILIRFSSADLIYFMFKSGLAKGLYCYVQLKDVEDKKLWELIDIPANPCLPRIYKSDGPEIQKYMTIDKIIDTEKGKFGILNMDGEVYNSMDLAAYHKAGEGHINYDEWLAMREIEVEKIKKEIENGFINDRRLDVECLPSTL